jgi:hypothetical protein
MWMRWFASAGLMAAMALGAVVAPDTARASCSDRKTTGTLLGGVGGAVIGNSIARGPGGIILGGVGGALAGRAIAGSTCGHERRAEYRRHWRGYGPYPEGSQFVEGPPPPPAYFDQRGVLIQPAVYAAGGPPPPPPTCRMETLTYYDDRGALVTRPVQACAQ